MCHQGGQVDRYIVRVGPVRRDKALLADVITDNVHGSIIEWDSLPLLGYRVRHGAEI